MSIYPAFIISLDVELLWGFKLHPKAPKRGLLLKDEKKGRGTIDALLTLFEKYNIPSTWAFVGHLFLDHHKREGEIVPYCMPQPHWRCSSSRCTNSLEDPLFYYGRDIVEKIISGNIKHEIGYHSFSHVRFSECSREIAQIEIKEGVRIAKELGISFNSFVFPENKIGHRDILKENGFRIYRGPNFGGKNVNKSLPVRAINRSLCKIISPPTEPIWREGIWEIPSSMWFYDPIFPFSLVFRATAGIQKSIEYKKIFHIFAHPEDFIAKPNLLSKLEKVLEFVSLKREEGRIHVLTMGELSTALNQKYRPQRD